MTDGVPRTTGLRAEFLVVALLFLTAGALRINDLFLYTPDSARYLVWGESLARGDGYLDATQPEEHRYVTHAPLYPALLAPVAAFAPAGVAAAKAATLGWGLLALLFLQLWLTDLLGRGAAFAGTAILAFSPAFLVHSTEVLSEAPFIAFLLAAFWLSARGARRGAFTRAEWFALAAVTALLPLLREVGAGAAAGIALATGFREPKKGLALAALSAAAVAAWTVRNSILVGPPPGVPGGNASLLLEKILTGPEGSLAAEFAARIATGAAFYGAQVAGLGFVGASDPAVAPLSGEAGLADTSWRAAAIALTALLMTVGLLRLLRTAATPLLAGAALLAAAVLYPVRDLRFLAPLLPVMILLLTAGAAAIGRAVAGGGSRGGGEKSGAGRGGGIAPIVVAALVVAVNLPLVAGLIRLNLAYRGDPEALADAASRGASIHEYYTRPWELLRARMTGSLPAGAVLASPAKELALFSDGRKVLELDPGVSQTVFDRLLRYHGVTHLLAPVRWADVPVYAPLSAGSLRHRFVPVADAGALRLLAVRPGEGAVPGEGAARDGAAPRRGEPDHPAPLHATPSGPSGPGSAALTFDSALGLIAREEYAPALDLLGGIVAAGHDRPEVRSAAVAAASMGGDTARAAAEFSALAALRQAASFLFPSRRHLELGAAAAEISGLPPGMERSMRALDASRAYWEMGWRARAAGLLGPEMEGDTLFFVGHLWDFHYRFQGGDTAGARAALRRLDRIDSTNSLVRNFHELLRLRRERLTARSAAEAVAVRLRMAGIYRAIELPDEAWDEAEAAFLADPSSPEAVLLLANLSADAGFPRRGLALCRDHLSRHPDRAGVAAKADSLAALLSR